MDRLRSLLSRLWLQLTLVAVASAVLLLPNLDMGLYDPWETHYAEVARRIDLDGDWITLRWHSHSRLARDANARCFHDPEQCHFFSKPVFIFWLMALSFRVFGVGDGAARLPMILLGIAGIVGLFYYVRRTFGARAGLLGAAVLVTMPYYYLLSRQIMTDIAFVVPMSIGLMALSHYLANSRARPRHLYLFYAMAGVATLAKGLLGFLLPGAIVLCVLVLQPLSLGRNLKRLRIPQGLVVFLVVAGPWYAVTALIHGDAWYQEFIVKHHLRRARQGVHGERGTFEYFVEQLAYGLWPWVALVPAAFVRWLQAGRSKSQPEPSLAGSRRDLGAANQVRSFLLVWAAVAFGVFTLSTTKFHHYAFPVVPPVAALIGLSLSSFWENKSPKAGFHVLALCGAGLLAAVTPILVDEPHRFINLFIYKYDRRYPEIEGAASWLLWATGIFGVGLALVFVERLKKLAVALLFAGAVVAAGWNVQGYMVGLDSALSQREAFAAFDGLRRPGDRLYEWALRWRGEVWYSRDTCHEIPQRSVGRMRRALSRPGRAFIVTTSADALNGKIRRLFGREARVLNDPPGRYAMTLWEGPSQGDGDRYLVRRVPARATSVNARLAENVEILAYELPQEPIRPGQALELTVYFKCTGPVRGDWTVFVHGDHRDEGSGPMRLLSDHPPAGGLLPTSRWRPGQIIKDVVQIETRSNQRPGVYELFVGLFRDNGGRMAVESGPNDGANRVVLGTATVGR